MDDRDRDLTHLFGRDLDEIPLPPRGVWRRTQEKEHIVMRTSRSLLTAGAAVAVLVLALVVGLQLRDRSETAASPSASPRPSPTATAPGAVAPTASPSGAASSTPSAAASAILDDTFGFVVLGVGGSATIRSETGATIAAVNGLRFVASPIGDRVAYVVLDAGRPVIHVRTIATGVDVSRLSLGAADGITGIAWSTDGNGLLIGSGQGADTGPAPTTPALLQTIEVSGGGPTLVASRQDGKVYAPVAWDRTAKLAVAAETGAGGFASAYLTFDLSQSPARAKSVPVSGRAGIPTSSSDGKYAQLTDLDSREVRYWPIADLAAAKPAGTAATGGLWQPGSHRIGFLSGDALVLFDADAGSTRTVVRGLKTTIPTQTQPGGVTLAAFRADGSAIVLAEPRGTGATSTEYTLVRVVDGASATFKVESTDGISAAVRLR